AEGGDTADHGRDGAGFEHLYRGAKESLVTKRVVLDQVGKSCDAQPRQCGGALRPDALYKLNRRIEREHGRLHEGVSHELSTLWLTRMPAKRARNWECEKVRKRRGAFAAMHNVP